MVRRATDRVLAVFTDWFCSKGGVWQTAVATLGVAAVELGDRRLDPHAFLLMAVLTVYSAITQPALAYGNAASAEKLDAALTRVEQLETQNAALLARMDHLIEGQGAIHAAVTA